MGPLSFWTRYKQSNDQICNPTHVLSVSLYVISAFKTANTKTNQKPKLSLQKQGKDHILDVPPSTCAAVTAGICFALSVGSEEGREERDELVWSDWWVGGGEGQR